MTPFIRNFFISSLLKKSLNSYNYVNENKLFIFFAPYAKLFLKSIATKGFQKERYL